MHLNRIERIGILVVRGILGPIQFGLNRMSRRRREKRLEQGAEEAYFEEWRAMKAYPPSSRGSWVPLALYEALLLLLVLWTALEVI